MHKLHKWCKQILTRLHQSQTRNKISAFITVILCYFLHWTIYHLHSDVQYICISPNQSSITLLRENNIHPYLNPTFIHQTKTNYSEYAVTTIVQPACRLLTWATPGFLILPLFVPGLPYKVDSGCHSMNNICHHDKIPNKFLLYMHVAMITEAWTLTLLY